MPQLLATSYGDPLFEYAAVRERGAGLIDLSSRGRLFVGGSEAVQFLNGLITNDMKTLAENRWMPAVFPNVQGRLIAAVRIVNSGDGFLIDTEDTTSEQVLQTVSRFTLAGDFRVNDLSEQVSTLSLQGCKSKDILAAIFGESVTQVEEFSAAKSTWNESAITIINASHTAAIGFDVFCDAAVKTALWDALLNAGARPVGADAFEILRIEAGEARYGVDMDETHVVSETNLDDAVSFTKGCYIGQEIIARIKYRGHVAKKLTGVRFDRLVTVERGSAIVSVDGKEIGKITSATMSPHLGYTVGLGYVKYDYLNPGTELLVSINGEMMRATVDLTTASRLSVTPVTR